MAIFFNLREMYWLWRLEVCRGGKPALKIHLEITSGVRKPDSPVTGKSTRHWIQKKCCEMVKGCNMIPLFCKEGNAPIPGSLSVPFPALGILSSWLWGSTGPSRVRRVPWSAWAACPGSFPSLGKQFWIPAAREGNWSSLSFSGEVLKPPAPMQSKRLLFLYRFFLRWLCFRMKVFVVAVLQGSLGWPCAPGIAHQRRSVLGPRSCSWPQQRSKGELWQGLGSAPGGYRAQSRMQVPKEKPHISALFLPWKAASLHLGLSNDAKPLVHRGVEWAAMGRGLFTCHNENFFDFVNKTSLPEGAAKQWKCEVQNQV